jgi:hypothetical protein
MIAPLVALAWLELQLQAARGELGETQGQRRHHRRQAISWATGPGRLGPLSPRAVAAALRLDARALRVAVLASARGPARRRRRGRPCTSSRPAFTPLAPAVSELLAHTTRGLRGLAAAILNRAIADLEGPGVVAGQARAWIGCRGEEHVFSFEGTCSILGLDAERVRRSPALVSARQGASAACVSPGAPLLSAAP